MALMVEDIHFLPISMIHLYIYYVVIMMQHISDGLAALLYFSEHCQWGVIMDMGCSNV